MPHKPDWRKRVPALGDVYMFQGALLCEDCGQSVQNKIRAAGKAPENETDEGSFDSDDFPKGPFGDGGGESDTINHCYNGTSCPNAIELPCGSKIGAWLGNDLTNDGVDWLVQSIRSSIFTNDNHNRQVNRLWNLKYWDSISGFNPIDPVTESNMESNLVKQFVSEIGGAQPRLGNQVWYDMDCLYGFYLQKAVPDRKQPASLIVWKSDILPDGSLNKPSKVELPISEAQEREPDDILAELIGDGAWD
jgi:hypothetical protein